jgi:hypothetical protein
MQRVFIDESGIQGSRYLVIGSIWVHEEALAELEAKFAPVMEAHFPNHRELKWTKISRTKLAGYLAFVDSFVSTLGARYRCVVLDTHKIDHTKFNHGDANTGYYKFVYQLVCQNIHKDRQLFGVQDKYLVFHDIVSTTIRQQASLGELKRILNNSPKLITDSNSLNPVRDIQPLDSKLSLPLQLTDILTGAVRHAFEMQGDYSASSPAKRAVIEHIQDQLSIKNIGSPTTYVREKFNTWEFRLT